MENLVDARNKTVLNLDKAMGGFSSNESTTLTTEDGWMLGFAPSMGVVVGYADDRNHHSIWIPTDALPALKRAIALAEAGGYVDECGYVEEAK